MADMTEERQDKMRAIVEAFRDAAVKNLEERTSQSGLDGVAPMDVQEFVAYDTWLKLDKQEQSFNEAAKRQEAQAYAHKAYTGHNPAPGCCPSGPKP